MDSMRLIIFAKLFSFMYTLYQILNAANVDIIHLVFYKARKVYSYDVHSSFK